MKDATETKRQEQDQYISPTGGITAKREGRLVQLSVKH